MVASPEKHDITFAGFLGANPFDEQRIARPNRRQHAPTRHAQPQLPRPEQHFAREFAFYCVDFVDSIIHECLVPLLFGSTAAKSAAAFAAHFCG
jgi:hypothetical protein